MLEWLSSSLSFLKLLVETYQTMHLSINFFTVNSSVTNTTLNNISEVTNATAIVEQQEKLDRLSLLTSLIETLNHGVDTGIRILLCYRIAVQLGKSYQVLLTLSNPMRFLQEIVSSPCDRKLEIARDIITTYQIDNQKIAHFLAEEIVAHITQVIEGNCFHIECSKTK